MINCIKIFDFLYQIFFTIKLESNDLFINRQQKINVFGNYENIEFV